MKYAYIIIAFLLVLAACQQTVPTSDPEEAPDGLSLAGGQLTIDQDIRIKRFSSAEEFRVFLQENRGGNAYYAMNTRMQNVAMDMVAAVPEAAGGSDHSKTNVQVIGVDEADIIKTDGEYVYTLSGNTVHILEAGEDAHILWSERLNGTPQGIFIDKDRMAVFGNIYDSAIYRGLNFVPRYGMTFVNIYDVSDREEPVLIKEYGLEGRYFRGRMTDGFMYLLTSSEPHYRYEHPMPVIYDDAEVIPLAAERIHYFDIPYENPTLVSIHAIGLEEASITSESLAVEAGEELYMSEDAIYVTFREWINEYELREDIIMELLYDDLSVADKQLIEAIEDVDSAILSRHEKRRKTLEIFSQHLYRLPASEQDQVEEDAERLLKEKLEEFEYQEFTVIHKVSVDGDDITPEGIGKVPGGIINQFSMDEHDGVFRVATTLHERWGISRQEESSNNVFTLDEDLAILDSLMDIAPGEQIYSTRFMGDRLYMVTFEQIDPFFVIDLSDPADIRSLGELKIPGFSRYLHPYDDATIIGIGKDATETGRQQGLKISLFDVSDVDDPQEIAQYVAESRYSDSTALWEHKAFLLSKKKNLLVIPAYSYDYREEGEQYNGAFVFNITRDSIKLRGLIDHSQGDRYYGAAVQRSLYIEDLLYTKSENLLRVNRLDTLTGVKNITLGSSVTDIPIY